MNGDVIESPLCAASEEADPIVCVLQQGPAVGPWVEVVHTRAPWTPESEGGAGRFQALPAGIKVVEEA